MIEALVDILENTDVKEESDQLITIRSRKGMKPQKLIDLDAREVYSRIALPPSKVEGPFLLTTVLSFAARNRHFVATSCSVIPC
jgi:hypothetical protein